MEEAFGLDSRPMTEKLPAKVYERELVRLQEELVKMKEWVHDPAPGS